MKKDIQQTWFFNQSPTEVWQYLTDAQLIAQWLAPSDFKPIVGHKFMFADSCTDHAGKAVTTFCTVLEVVPNQKLSYTWQKGTTEDEIKLDSVVTFTLTPKGAGTQLLLQHNGFALLEETLQHTNGWNSCMNKITELLNAAAHVNTNA